MQRTFKTGIFILGAIAMACGGASLKGSASGADVEGETYPSAPKPAARGAYYTGKYKNMFAELGKSNTEIKNRVEDAYQQLFHGNPDTEAVMYAGKPNKNGPTAYIMDVASDDARSEGLSYGMMIALQLDKKEDFDALWNWAYSYMYHTDETHPNYGYFSWSMNVDGTPRDDNPAPDGEEYFAMALLFASHRWGDGEGIYNYRAAAHKILTDMIHREDKTGEITQWDGEKKTTFKMTTTIVALMHPEHYMIRFTPNTANFKTNSDHTDPSYHLPSFYELFALWGPEDDKEFWHKAAEVSRDYFVEVTHPETGLSPDYAAYDGTPVAASWNPNTRHFLTDAHRTAMNWAMDCAWWGKDAERQEQLTNRLHRFFEKEGVYAHRAAYKLDGSEPVVDYQAMSLTAMNAAAGICGSEPVTWEFIDMLWRTPLKTGKWRYYDGMLTMFALLHLSGQYKIYKPV